MSGSSRPFVAFISYSHRDTVWAAWIQKAVERYRLPNALAKETGLDKKVGKVFRDREELATGQNLGDHLLAALDNSDNLIVICSPNAVNSQWVGQEIEYFKSIGRGDRIFCLLVEGGAESLPEPLLTDVEGNPLEPLAADPRETGDGKRLAKLKLISGILGVKLDQLTRREQARQNQLRLFYSGIAGLVMFMSAAAFVSYREQQLARQQEAFERETAMENAANMVEFAERIRTQIDMESQALVNNQLIEYLERSGTDNLDVDTTRYLAQAYRQLGIAKLEQGTDERAIVDEAAANAAVDNFARSSELFDIVIKTTPKDPQALFDVGIADFWAGYTRLRRGELDQARAPLVSYTDIMADLYQQDPNNPDFVTERVFAQQTLLTLTIESVDTYTDELAEQIETAVSIAEAATAQFPKNADIWDAQVAILNLAASGLAQQCLYEDGKILLYREQASESAMRALELEPRSRFFKRGVADLLSNLGHTYDALADLPKAREALRGAYRLRLELADTDPTNQFAAAQLMKSSLDIFRLLTLSNNIDEASFTELQAISNVTSNSGREAATEFGIEHVWLLFNLEAELLNDNTVLVEAYLRDMMAIITQMDSQVSVTNLRTTLMAGVIANSINLNLNSMVSSSIPHPGQDMDCRTRETRWLWHVAEGNENNATSELADLKASYKGPSYLKFYEALVNESR